MIVFRILFLFGGFFLFSNIGHVYSDYSLYTINITCPDGWQKALNNCYLFNLKDQLTWDEARTECALQNADLMIFSTKEERDWINIQTEEYHTDEWWVGLKYGPRYWDWVQYGGDRTLINWRNEPDNDDNQDCCAINEFGLFSDEYCSSKLGFICSYPINRGEYCASTDSTTWLMTDTSCFFISPLLNNSLHLDWNSAKSYCDSLVPGKHAQLMSIINYDDMRSLRRLLYTYNPAGVMLPWWTSLNDQQTEGKYVWQNGSIANGSWIQWDVAPSSDRSLKRNCGLLYQGGAIQDATCDKRAHYICEKTAIQAKLNLGCGSWLRGGQSCYLIGKGKGYTQAQAGSKCTAAGAQLLKVDSMDERVWIENLLLGGIGFWTGLTRAPDKQHWIWGDQSLSDSSLINWSHEPNNNGGKEDCVEIHRDGQYNDRRCDSKVGYICEYPMPFGSQCPSGWPKCEQSCYYISPANDSFSVTWPEAQQRCSDIGSAHNLQAGQRLAVDDTTEQTCVNQFLSQLPPSAPGFWTDLTDLKYKGIWQYSNEADNPPNKDVISWVHEPNNFNNSENCAVIYQGGYYNDLNCQAQAFYICERTYHSVTPSPSGNPGSATYSSSHTRSPGSTAASGSLGPTTPSRGKNSNRCHRREPKSDSSSEKISVMTFLAASIVSLLIDL